MDTIPIDKNEAQRLISLLKPYFLDMSITEIRDFLDNNIEKNRLSDALSGVPII